MKTKISVALFCAAAGVPAVAATYWTGANGTEFAVVGDAGNADNGYGKGSVDYEYSIGKYEVTNAQYANFLNAVGAASVTAGTGSVSLYGGSVITNSGGVFSVSSTAANKAVSYVSAYAAAMYCNWLGNGASADSDWLTGAYDFSDGASASVLGNVSADAPYRLPTLDEWFKAAYYDPEKNDGAGGYWKQPTRSDSISVSDANYGDAVGGITDVGSYAKASAYGTFDQRGNVWEWFWSGETETVGAQGYSFSASQFAVESGMIPLDYSPDAEYANFGFRVVSLATVPEQSAFGLLAGTLVLALAASRRRRKKD